MFYIITRTQKFNYVNFSIRGSQIVGGFNCFFDSWPFYRAKNWETENTVFGYKKGKKFNPTRFSEPWPLYFGWFHLLFFSHDHFVQPKAEKRKIPFLVYTKRCENSIPTWFSDAWPQIVGSFICYFWLMTIYQAKSWKMKSIVFGYKKRSRFNPPRFSDLRPPYCG